jgi:hypothetical protein
MRNSNRDAREGGTSIYTMAGLAVLVVLALLFTWEPWSGLRVADNSAPFTTVGSSTTRPSANLSPTAPDPITPAVPSPAPAEPSTTR